MKTKSIIGLCIIFPILSLSAYADDPANLFHITTSFVVKNNTSNTLQLKTDFFMGTNAGSYTDENYMFLVSDPADKKYANETLEETLQPMPKESSINNKNTTNNIETINYFNTVAELDGSPSSYYMTIYKATGASSPKYEEICNIVMSNNIYYATTDDQGHQLYNHPLVLSVYNNPSDTSEYCTTDITQPKHSVSFTPITLKERTMDSDFSEYTGVYVLPQN